MIGRPSGIRIVLGVITIGLLAVFGLAALIFLQGNVTITVNSDSAFEAVEASDDGFLDPPEPIAPFSLTNTAGDTFGLDDLSGKPTLIYFGYTYCPDVCPITMIDYQRVKRDLETPEAVNFVMVSVDGERDTPDLLGRYLSRFDPAFIGLTGTTEAVRPVADAFSVDFFKREVEGTEASYLIDHTASTFLLNAGGELVKVYPFGTDPAIIAGDLQMLL